MRVLITGNQGMAGTWLRRSLEADGHRVFGFDLLTGGDVTDYGELLDAVTTVTPHQVFHLAAVARPAQALVSPRYAAEVNITGTLNVLEAIRSHAPDAHVLIAGSSDEYGNDARDPCEVLTEESVCRPSSPYGASKLAATALAMAYAKSYRLNVVVTRAWMHTGPHSPATAVLSAFAQRIVAVERGGADHVPHGDLSGRLDISDVRDVVRAYRLAIGLEPGIYNVCREELVPLGFCMTTLTCSSPVSVVLKEDPSLGAHKKSGHVPQASCAKLRAATGWKPEVPLATTLSDLLDYWRTC